MKFKTLKELCPVYPYGLYNLEENFKIIFGICNETFKFRNKQRFKEFRDILFEIKMKPSKDEDKTPVGCSGYEKPKRRYRRRK